MRTDYKLSPSYIVARKLNISKELVEEMRDISFDVAMHDRDMISQEDFDSMISRGKYLPPKFCPALDSILNLEDKLDTERSKYNIRDAMRETVLDLNDENKIEDIFLKLIRLKFGISNIHDYS